MIEEHRLELIRRWAEVNRYEHPPELAATVLQLLDHYENRTIEIKLSGRVNGNHEEIGRAIGELINTITPQHAEALGRTMLEQIGHQVLEDRFSPPDESQPDT